MNERTITALYENRSDAEAARRSLIAAGIPGDEITLRAADRADAPTDGASTDYEGRRDEGFWAALKDLFVPEEDRYTYAEGLRRGGVLLTAHLHDGEADRVIDALEHSNAIDLDTRVEEWRRSGWSGYGAGLGASATERDSTETVTPATGAVPPAGTGVPATGAPAVGMAGGAAAGARTAAGMRGEREEAIPIVEEQLRIGKREVERGGVRVRSYVVETPIEEQVRLRDETLHVERRPVERELRPGDAAPFQEKTIEVTETDEEAVVSKTARVKEELVVRKDVAEHTETVRDSVRRTEVDIEDSRTGGPARGVAGEKPPRP